jgi:hypothetical protein
LPGEFEAVGQLRRARKASAVRFSGHHFSLNRQVTSLCEIYTEARRSSGNFVLIDSLAIDGHRNGWRGSNRGWERRS